MKKQTYYIVQTADCADPAKAAPLTLSQARRICRELRGADKEHKPYGPARRFPRIVQVTVETRVVKDRR